MNAQGVELAGPFIAMSLTAQTIHSCRVCHGIGLVPVHAFGEMPLADKLMSAPDEMVPSCALSLVRCERCAHVQILESIDPEILFRENYPYFSGDIPEMVVHFAKYADDVMRELEPDPAGLVVEIASNDGTLLSHFKSAGFQVLGIEPSLSPAKRAEERGIDVIREFFGPDVARSVIDLKGRKAALILANNVLAHVPDPAGFARGIAELLDEDGTAVIEVPRSLAMLESGAYDVIFHQHFSYFTMHSLRALFLSAGLHIRDKVDVNTQGGSYRLFVGHAGTEGRDVVGELVKEEQLGIGGSALFSRFSDSIRKNKQDMMQLLGSLKAEGRSVVGYGAPGKAATFLNYNGIERVHLRFLVDISKAKQGKFYPLAGIPVYGPERLLESPPDYLLLLAWNYADSIMEKWRRELPATRFIVPYPEVRIV